MRRGELLEQVKCVIRKIEPNAEVILYGSRSRGDAGTEADWDFLILVDGPVTEERKDIIRYQLYEIEWDSGEVISAIVWCREEWHSPRCRALPFYQNIEREGQVL